MNHTAAEIQLHETDPDILYRLITVNKSAQLNYWHAETELIEVLDDKMIYKVNGNAYMLNQGDILLIPGGSIHKVETPESRHNVIQFDLSLFESKTFKYHMVSEIKDKFEQLERCSQNWPLSAKSAVTEIIAQLKSVKSNPPGTKTAYLLKIQSLLYQLVNIFWNDIPERNYNTHEYKPPYDTKMLRKLEKVLDYIKKHYAEQIDLRTISQVANYSINHFTKIWFRYMGIHFHTYLNDYRISEAMSLLKESHLSITEIASKCGFGSYKTFIRIFKQSTGMSASEFRKLNKS